MIKPLYLSGNAIAEAASTDSVQLATVGIGTAPTSDGLVVVPSSATDKGVVVKGFSGQTANLQEWQSSAASVLVSIEADGTLNLASDFQHTGSAFGVFGATPTGQTAAYTPSNVSPDRSYDASSTTVGELANVLGTLISDLQDFGFLG